MSQTTLPGIVKLSARSDTGATRHYDLHPDQGVFAGSSSNCGLQLPGDGIADIHCRIGFEEGKLYVQSWMSAEGIIVNGQSISAKTEIGKGDVIQIGPHHISVQPQADAAPPAEQPKPDRYEPEAPPIESLPPQDAASQDAPSPIPSADILDDLDRHVEQASSDFSGAFDDHTDELDSANLGGDFFSFDDEETYDRETVDLLRAEIEDLQAALAQRDAELQFDNAVRENHPPAGEEASDDVLRRMDELVDEANRSDERVAMLEEMLHTSEVANRSEQEERHQLESWVSDIEQRLGQREDEHAAEIQALRDRLEQSNQQQQRLQKHVQQAAQSGSAPKHYEETLENLQARNNELQEKLATAEKRCLAAEQKLELAAGEQDRALREERASIAQERAKVSRLRFELSRKLSEIEELPKPENQADKETAHRIQTLRNHLREIHEQEKLEEKEAPLTSRLAKLWKRVEY